MKIKTLIDNLSNNNWEIALSASDELTKYHSKEVFYQLIATLNDAKTADTVNATVLALREIKNNKAVPFLVKALDKPININNKSTILYALENLDCSKYFLKIFTLFNTTKSDDVKLSAYDILSNTEFVLTRLEIEKGNKIVKENFLSIKDKEIAQNFLKKD